MLISLPILIRRHRLRIKGVVHVGAHTGEEAQVYKECSIGKVWWVEANESIIPWLTDNLKAYPGHTVIHALVTDEDNQEVAFHVTNNRQSSSIYELGTHKQSSPDVWYVRDVKMWSRTLDSLDYEYDFEDSNFMNLDLQGAELLALKGAEKLLDKIDYIYSEVNEEQVYVGCAQVSEMDDYLSDFRRVETEFTPAGWGDALWVRKKD